MNEEVCNVWEEALKYAAPLPVSHTVSKVTEQLPKRNFQHLHLEDRMNAPTSQKYEDLSRHSSNESIDVLDTLNSQSSTSTSYVAMENCDASLLTTHAQIDINKPLLNCENSHMGGNSVYVHNGNSELSNNELDIQSESAIMTLLERHEHASVCDTSSDITHMHNVTSCEDFTDIPVLTSNNIVEEITSIDPMSDDLRPEEMIHDLTYNKTDYLYDLKVKDVDDPDDLQPKVKKKRNRTKNPDPPPMAVLPPCKVCDDKASGYHYGANTCEACKGFFRRTLKKKEVNYKCKCKPEERPCWKRGSVKNGCPACRYERCLDVGMSKNAIKIGRYTIGHKTNNIKEVKSIETLDQPSPSVSTESQNEPSPFTAESESVQAETSSAHQEPSSPSNGDSWIDILLKSCIMDSASPPSTNSDHVSLNNTGSNQPSIETENNNSVPSSSSCDADDDVIEPPAKKRLTVTMPAYVKAGMTLREIDTIIKTVTEAHLSTRTVVELPTAEVKQRHAEYLEKYKLKTQLFGEMRTLTNAEFYEFYKATGIDIDGRMEEVNTILTYFEHRISMLVAFAKAIPGLKQLPLDDQAELVKASRHESGLLGSYRVQARNTNIKKKVLIMPWGQELHFAELTKFFPINMLMERYAFVQKVLALDMSIQEEAMLRAVIITSSDRCCLKEPKKTEELNEKMLACLQHLLNVRHGGPGNIFYKTIDILTGMRIVSENASRFAADMMRQPLISHKLKNFSLIREFIT